VSATTKSVGPRPKITSASAWKAGIAVLSALIAAPAMADSGCALNQVADLPATFGHGEIAVDVGINGQKARFSLSTGSNITEISEALVQRLGLSEVDMHARTQSRKGTQETMIALVQDFTIGAAVSHASRFVVDPDGGDGTTGDITGIIGLDYLSHFDIELDPGQGRVRLFQPIQCERAVYWWDDHFEVPFTLNAVSEPVIPISLDGKPYRAYINIASPRSSIDVTEAHRNLNVPESLQPGADGESNLDYAFKELVFGPITLRNPKILLTRYKATAVDTGSHIRLATSNDAPIILGMDVLGKFHSMISFGLGKIYFTLPGERKPVPAAGAKL